MVQSRLPHQWQLLKTKIILPATSQQPWFRLNGVDAGTRLMYMVRPLIFSSHLDEAKLQAAVKTLVNACPFLAGRLQKDPSTGEFAILCSNSATTTRNEDPAVPGTEELAFGVPLSFVTWDCSVKDVIPGALVAYGEQGPTGINLLAHPPPFVDSLDCAAAAEGREPIMKVRYTSLRDGSILTLLLSHTIADGARFANLVYALSAVYRGDPLPHMLHDRTLLSPASLIRAAEKVLGARAPLEGAGEEGPGTSGATVMGGGQPAQYGGVTSTAGHPPGMVVNGSSSSSSFSLSTAAATEHDQPGPSASHNGGTSASPSVHTADASGSAAAQQPASQHVLAAVHLPSSVIAALKAQATEHLKVTSLNGASKQAVRLSGNDIAMGLFAVARATMSGLPLPGTKLSGAKGSESTKDEPAGEAPGAWKLLMLADLVYNGFPLADALSLKSYLGNLVEIWAIDSRECPWVPELDDLTENPDPTQCTSTGILSAEALAHGSCSQHSAANGASGSKKGAALLQQSLFSAAMGSRSAVARLRSKYGSPACLEGVLLFSEYGHKDFPELMPVFDRLHQGLPATTLGTGTNLSQHDDGVWGDAQLVMAPWGWSTNIPGTNMAICQGPRVAGQQPDGVVLHIMAKVGEEVERLRQVTTQVCPGAVWWGP